MLDSLKADGEVDEDLNMKIFGSHYQFYTEEGVYQKKSLLQIFNIYITNMKSLYMVPMNEFTDKTPATSSDPNRYKVERRMVSEILVNVAGDFQEVLPSLIDAIKRVSANSIDSQKSRN